MDNNQTLHSPYTITIHTSKLYFVPQQLCCHDNIIHVYNHRKEDKKHKSIQHSGS